MATIVMIIETIIGYIVDICGGLLTKGTVCAVINSGAMVCDKVGDVCEKVVEFVCPA
jgi:hypothetical protein